MPSQTGSAGTGADRPRKKIQRKRLAVAPYFLALVAVVAVLWISALAGSGFKFPTPKLGLDLQGGLSMTLTTYLQGSDETPNAETMEEARQIIEGRVNSTGVSEPEVFVEGNDNIVVNVAGQDTDEEALRTVGAPAELRFRIVTDYQADLSGSIDQLTGEDSEEDDSAEEPTEGAEDEATDEATEESGEDAGASEETDENTGGSQVATSGEDPTIEDVWATVGEEAATLAQSLTTTPTDPASVTTLKPFADLTEAEIALLPAEVQFYTPTISCEQLDNRPPGSVELPDVDVTACSEPAPVTAEEGAPEIPSKYLLQPATVLGSDVESADVGTDQANLNNYVVNIQFTSAGAQTWGALTNANTGNQVAIVLDLEVVSAPVIQEASAATTQISGDFTADEAGNLADQLNFGSLPINFDRGTISEVTATLGVEQLEAGLLAGAIGLALVFLYCIAYYRVLGFVVLGSLITATLVLYPTVALLGSQISMTLTLAGIAGFVVAIGITADSFVVYFERIKEEMRDGRSARSAVPRAWVRTRRTILSANTVSIISALVLYFLAIGPVRAFAFALGLSTLVNILVVFLFTHPIAEYLGRGRVLNNVHLSGLHTRPIPGTGKTAARVGSTTR